MQGYPLEMIAYGIGILPLIKNLKQGIHAVTHPLYPGDARSLGMFARIGTYFNLPTYQGPGCRYHPELSKSVLILHLENLRSGKEFG